MLSDFLIFYAPFLFVLLAIITAFWIAPKDDAVIK